MALPKFKAESKLISGVQRGAFQHTIRIANCHSKMRLISPKRVSFHGGSVCFEETEMNRQVGSTIAAQINAHLLPNKWQRRLAGFECHLAFQNVFLLRLDEIRDAVAGVAPG